MGGGVRTNGVVMPLLERKDKVTRLTIERVDCLHAWLVTESTDTKIIRVKFSNAITR